MATVLQLDKILGPVQFAPDISNQDYLVRIYRDTTENLIKYQVSTNKGVSWITVMPDASRAKSGEVPIMTADGQVVWKKPSFDIFNPSVFRKDSILRFDGSSIAPLHKGDPDTVLAVDGSGVLKYVPSSTLGTPFYRGTQNLIAGQDYIDVTLLTPLTTPIISVVCSVSKPTMGTLTIVASPQRSTYTNSTFTADLSAMPDISGYVLDYMAFN